MKTGQLTKFNYVDQGRLQLNEERTVLDEVGDGTEFVHWGDGETFRALLSETVSVRRRPHHDAGEKT